MFHRIFSLIQLPSDPVNDLLFYYFIVLAENFIADETNSATVDPKDIGNDFQIRIQRRQNLLS